MSESSSPVSLSDQKQAFIDFMLECNVLRFGDFTTKSGRKTPYFVNTGHYDNGHRLRVLGEFYAHAIMQQIGPEFDVIYGPAYKGIPLAVAAGSALDRLYGLTRGVTFNRKEAKDHGEGGVLVGHPIVNGSRIVIIDDVVTAGTSVAESVEILTQAAKVNLTALIVSVDRQERGNGELSALQEVEKRHGLKTGAIVSLDDILACVKARSHSGIPMVDADTEARIVKYRKQYGV
tara:strand:- start:129 stop:827 length:699 start_codon:yes stop_codon:yes gene_type:complete